MKKRLLSLVLALVLVLSMVPVATIAANFEVTIWFHNTSTAPKFVKAPSSTPTYYSVTDGSVALWEGETPPEKNYIKVLYTNTDYPHVELTLNEVTIESMRTTASANAAIYFSYATGNDYAITVNLIGENKITTGRNAGLRVAGKLGTTITGDGSLIMEGTDPDGLILTDNGGDLTIKDTTVNLNNKHGGWYHGIFATSAGTDVIINGSDFTSFGAIYFGKSRSSTDSTNEHNISVINGSNVNVSHSGQSSLAAFHNATGTVLIRDSNVSAYTTINGGRGMRRAPVLEGNYIAQYSTNKTGSFTSPQTFDVEAGTALSNDSHRYIKITHVCITEDNDGNCTTPAICGCGKTIIEAAEAHVPGEPSGDCTVGVKCVNCNTYTTPAKDHDLREPVIENETDAGYDNVYICDDCGMEVLREYISKLCPHTNSSLVNQDDATCTENGLAIYHCSDCNEDYEVVLTAPGHDHQVTNVVGATINSKGYTVYTCTVCGDTYHDNFVDKILPIAIIGTTPYFTLKEAVEAAQPGDVIILCRSQKVGEGVYIEKDLTIDFNGCYYSMDKAHDGAAMYIARGTTVTLMNGKPQREAKLTITYSNADGVCATSFTNLIKNYGTLNVQGVVLNGSNTHADPDTSTLFNAGVAHLGSGTVVTARTIALKNEGTLTKDADVDVPAPEGFHFDNGKLESHTYVPTQHGATVYEVAYTLHTCKCGAFFKEYTGTTKLSVYAKNPATGMHYASLQEAIDAAENGQLIEMTQRCKTGSTVVIPAGKKITIDMKGYYYAITYVTNGAGLIIEEGAELNLISTDATSRFMIEYVAHEYAAAPIEAVIKNNGKLTAENIHINGNNLFGTGNFAVMNYNELTLKANTFITVFAESNVGEIMGNYTQEESTDARLADAELLENVDVQKSASAGSAVTLHPGSAVTYTITLTNNNGVPVSLNVTDALPKHTEFVSGCEDVRDKNLHWNVKNLQPGEDYTITYTVKNTNTLKQVQNASADIVVKSTNVKVVGKSVETASGDIWVLETFNEEDQRKIEMGIDSMVTANLTAKNSSKLPLNRLPLATMMYYVGFSAGPGFGTNTDPAVVLDMIFEKAGENSGGSSSGGVEDVVDTAGNMLDKVVPTLYGGTAVSADKDAMFRGARATQVKVTDLISGDMVFVENDGATKLYIFDGTYLVELAETKVTTNIAPETVLSALPASDKYVVLRISISYNITFALNEGEYFNDYDKQEYTDLEKALIATAESYLLRGDRNQYTDDMTGTSQFRWQSSLNLPEDCTIDQYGYSNCAAFTFDVHWATYGIAHKATNAEGNSVTMNTTANLASATSRGWNPETLTGSNASSIFYCTPMKKNADGVYVSTMTAEEQATTKELIISLLRPGDIICIRRTGGSGHAMLYAGNGTIIHSSGSSYSDANKTDTHEATIRFRMVEDLFNPKVYASSSYVFNLASFSIVRLQNLKSSVAPTENTVNRVENMQGVVAEKVSTTAMGKTVNCGDEITYTFHIFNTNKAEKAFAIRDILDEDVTFVSTTNEGVADGSNISWDITVPAETRISVSYTVKVKDGLANYTEINNTKATINGVMHRCHNSYVANTLTAEQQQAFLEAVETVKGMDVSGLNSVEIVELIYNTAFGVDDLFGEKVTNFSMLLDGGNNQKNSTAIVKGEDNVGVFNDAWYWESSNKSTVALMNYNTSKPAMMVAPGLWGGQLVMNSTYNRNNRDERFTRYLDVDGSTVLRSRYYWEKDLVIGDIFLLKGSSSEQMFIYVGNDTFLSVGDGFDVFTEKSVAERFEYTPHSTWKKHAVLRPSFTLDI